MAHGVTCYSFLFFVDTIKPTYSFCNFVTMVNKIAKTVGFPVTSCTKLLKLYYDVTVEFSSNLTETSWQITAKQQNIKLELASLSQEQWRSESF